MRELGIEPPPKLSISQAWQQWNVWFQRLRNATPNTQTYTQTLNPSTVPANSTSEQTFTVPGLTTSDIVSGNKPSHTPGLAIGNCRVSADDTLAITFVNITGSGIDPPEEDYKIKSTRR